ncbi:hypothetical protein JCM11251_003365 [Rhodosporidiobolus azoricus]
MLASLALSALCASTALAHGPARLDQQHLALQRRQVASSILSSFQTAVSSAAGASATGASSAGDVDSASQSWLPLIVSSAQGTGCTSQADALTRAVAGCIAANTQDQVQAVACACGPQTLAIAEAAANCVVNDASSNGNSSTLQYYNAFVNQCITLNLSNSTALASISGQSVTAAVPTTTVMTASSSAAAGSTIVISASNATSIAEATGSASRAASSQVSLVQTTTTESAAAQSATTGGGNGATQVKVAGGALALVAGVVAILA